RRRWPRRGLLTRDGRRARRTRGRGRGWRRLSCRRLGRRRLRLGRSHQLVVVRRFILFGNRQRRRHGCRLGTGERAPRVTVWNRDLDVLHGGMRLLVHHHGQHDRRQQGERNGADQPPPRPLLDFQVVCVTH
ncbi:hypothetical protein RZS08_27210, partial [Arthrospira platensis SPKY1]|nr:hypothetical protein [Arthrospira platensis SPKY1]